MPKKDETERNIGPFIVMFLAVIIGLAVAIYHETIMRLIELPSASGLKNLAYIGLVPALLLYGLGLWAKRRRFWPFR
jgi:hypothetical protein